MIYENQSYGSARIASFVPTPIALRYLNSCTMAGWHRCNNLYRQEYKEGIKDAFLIYTVDGAGKMEADGKTYSLTPNSAVLVSPHVPMQYFTDPSAEAWEFYWLDLTGDRVLLLTESLRQDGYSFIFGLPSLAPIFDELLKEACSEFERSVWVGRVLEGILRKAVFSSCEKETCADQILSYLAEHYGESLDLHRLSAQFYLSQNQIIRTVRAHTGYTPHEYLIRIRMAKGCELLQFTTLPIGKIGRSVGYKNNSHFSAAFRRLYGMTPAQYRLHIGK